MFGNLIALFGEIGGDENVMVRLGHLLNPFNESSYSIEIVWLMRIKSEMESTSALALAGMSSVSKIVHAPIAYAGEFSIPIDAEFEETMTKQAAKKLAQQSKKYQIHKRIQ